MGSYVPSTPAQRQEMEVRYAEHAKQYALERSIQLTEEMFRQAMEEAEDLHA